MTRAFLSDKILEILKVCHSNIVNKMNIYKLHFPELNFRSRGNFKKIYFGEKEI